MLGRCGCFSGISTLLMHQGLFRRIAWILATFAVAPLYAPAAQGAPAKFWISTDGTQPNDPGVASYVSAINIPRNLYIWAQPRTSGAGDWHAVNNPFLTFQNVSLNVLSAETDFTIDPNNITVHNPLYSTANNRFDSLNDSSTGLTETTGAAPGPYDDPPIGFSKGLLDLQGYTFYSADADGFGPTCDSNDTLCGTTTSGSPAWLFATISVTPTADSGTVDFYLQVGRNGMNHTGEGSGDMLVEFGVDTMGAAPADYDPSTNRSVTLADDDADAVLTLAGPGDFDGDGDVDTDDYTVWKNNFGTSNYSADGNGDGTVDAGDYVIWRNNLGAVIPGALVHSTAIPEPAASTAIALLLFSFGYRCARRTRSNSDV